MPYAVTTPVFEGPLDVLLHLISKQKVELYEISIATIVDEFLAYVDEVDQRAKATGAARDLEVLTEFLLIAATLVQLKAQRLLPGREQIDLDDELSLWEERDLLLGRLVECKTFKDASFAFVALERVADRSYARTTGLEDRYLRLAPDPLEGMSPQRIRSAFLRAIKPKPPPPSVNLDHVTPLTITVGEAMSALVQELRQSTTRGFYELMDRRGSIRAESRMDVIVHFLGLLELYKQGIIDIEQANTFGDLEIRWLGYPDDEISLDLIDVYEG